MDDETDSWAHRDEIFAKTRERLKAKTTAEWLDILLPAGVWAGPVHGYAELVEDPQVRHNGSFIEYDHPSEGWVKTPGFPIRFSRTPPTLDRGAPQVGEKDRKRVVEGRGVSERVDLGGRRIIQQKHKQKHNQ